MALVSWSYRMTAMIHHSTGSLPQQVLDQSRADLVELVL